MNGVTFPVTEATSRIKICRAFFDADTIPDAASTVHTTSLAIPAVTQERSKMTAVFAGFQPAIDRLTGYAMRRLIHIAIALQ